MGLLQYVCRQACFNSPQGDYLTRKNSKFSSADHRLIKSKYKGTIATKSHNEQLTKYCFAGETADIAKASENSNVLSVGAPLHLLPPHQGSISVLIYPFFREKAANFCFTFNWGFIEKIQAPEPWGQ